MGALQLPEKEMGLVGALQLLGVMGMGSKYIAMFLSHNANMKW